MVGKGEVIKEERLNEHSATKLVKVEGHTYKVYQNDRTGPGDFESRWFCDICDPLGKKYNSKLIELPESKLRVCRSCICNMEQVLMAAEDYDNRKDRNE